MYVCMYIYIYIYIYLMCTTRLDWPRPRRARPAVSPSAVRVARYLSFMADALIPTFEYRIERDKFLTMLPRTLLQERPHDWPACPQT